MAARQRCPGSLPRPQGVRLRGTSAQHIPRRLTAKDLASPGLMLAGRRATPSARGGSERRGRAGPDCWCRSLPRVPRSARQAARGTTPMLSGSFKPEDSLRSCGRCAPFRISPAPEGPATQRTPQHSGVLFSPAGVPCRRGSPAKKVQQWTAVHMIPLDLSTLLSTSAPYRRGARLAV